MIAPMLHMPLFLLGMYAAKRQWFADPEQKSAIYRKYMLIFLPLGLLFKSYHLLYPEEIGAGTGLLVGGSLLSIGYMMAFVITSYSIHYTKLYEILSR